MGSSPQGDEIGQSTGSGELVSETQQPFTVYRDTEQWIPFRNWFWIRPGEAGMGHGPYWSKLSARLHARWANR